MRKLFVHILIFLPVFAFAQVELRTDGIVLPFIKRANVIAPSQGQLIIEPGNIPTYYEGTTWKDLQNFVWSKNVNSTVFYNEGKVGIGVTNPSDYLHINAPAGNDIVRFQRGGNTEFRIFSNGAVSIGTNWSTPEEDAIYLGGTRTIVNDTLFMVGKRVQITESGSISLLENGVERIRLDGDLNNKGRVTTNELELTGGSDFSEKFSMLSSDSKHVKPGMLVAVRGDNGELGITDTKIDRRVIGVVSGANGIETGLIMGQKGTIADGDFPVALSGRTYVYANTQNGAIKAGDFLTSSSQPGYAMKVKKMRKSQGAIIGKALTSLENGEGFVLVLVNLQ
jgi:hypothetical protein